MKDHRKTKSCFVNISLTENNYQINNMFHLNLLTNILSLSFLAIFFLFLSFLTYPYKDSTGVLYFLIIYFLFLVINCVFGLFFSIKYKDYFKIKKPIKWSGIKCQNCNYIGKPKKFKSEFTVIEYIFPIISIFKAPRRFNNLVKYFPIEYGCPHCLKPRKNYKNIEFIHK